MFLKGELTLIKAVNCQPRLHFPASNSTLKAYLQLRRR
jgi:hypothetical protein